jgi:hypothetical protein
LVSSIGLVLAVPWLLLVLVGLATGGFEVGPWELSVLWLTWAAGIALVVRSWLLRRRRPPSA